MAAGLLGFAHYSNTASSPGAPLPQWPPGTALALDLKRPTLVMFIHPQCPCTQASMGELERLMARAIGRCDAHVLVAHPKGLPESAVLSDLYRQAARIPGVRVQVDREDAEARLFHVVTSGDTLLYGPGGNLLFHGGITAARGHAGDNPGRSAILDLLKKPDGGPVETPVFGCSLLGDG